jgi:hypothetical protein
MHRTGTTTHGDSKALVTVLYLRSILSSVPYILNKVFPHPFNTIDLSNRTFNSVIVGIRSPSTIATRIAKDEKDYD